MEISGDPEALVLEINAMARRESAGLIAAAEEEARGLLSAAGTAAAAARRKTLASAQAGAARRRETLLASVPGEAGRLRAERREAALEAIKAEALRLLPAEAAAAGKRAVLAALAAQAIGRMEGKKFMIDLAPGDKGEAAGLPAEIERRAGRGHLELLVGEDPGLDGGVLVRGAEGRQRWDNGFRARLERAWPELRGRLLGEPK